MGSALGYFFVQGWKNIWNHRLVSLASTGIVAASLLLFGVFLLLEMNLEAVLGQVREQCQINVYLAEETTEEALFDIEEDLRAIEGVKAVEFYSKEERLQKVKETAYKGKEALLEDMEKDNPLRDSYLLTVVNLEESARITKEAGTVFGVDEVTDMQALADNIRRFTNAAERAGLVLMLIFVLAAIFIISNTIRMGMASRKQEITIMRCVGASGSYISGPFLVEGAMLGFFGALPAAALLLWGYTAVAQVAQNLISVEVVRLVDFSVAAEAVIFSFLTLGIGIGLLGSGFSVRRYKG